MKSAPRKIKGSVVILLSLSGFFIGCTPTIYSSTPRSDVDLKALNTFYIIRSESDRRGLHRAIVEELARRGKKATSGLRSSIPDDIDAVVVYRDNWVWDMQWYLLNLFIQLRDPETNVLLASASSNRPSVVRTTPDLMAREVLDAMLK
jgi:hypothetical protein